MLKRLFLFVTCLIIYNCYSLAQYSMKVGYTEFLSVTPPKGYVRSSTWTCNKGLKFTDKSEAGAIVEVTHYFEGSATVTCNYVFEYLGTYDHNMHASTGTKTFRITCIPGEAYLSAESLQMKVGQKRSLTCNQVDSYGKPTWESTDEDVVTVDDRGRVTAVGSGHATIVCDPIIAPNLVCEVDVEYIAPTAISLTPQSANIGLGKTKALVPNLSPSGASAEIKWASSNEKVATVSSAGLVKGISKGVAQISAITDNGLKAVTTVTVLKIQATGLTISPSNLEMKTGQKHTLKTVLTPSDAQNEIAWSSLNKDVAIVSSTGVVTAIGVGKTSIVAKTDNGFSATTTVNVEYASEDELDALNPLRGEVSASLHGDGTQSSPYLIQTAADLRYLSDECRKGNTFAGCYFKMTNDIVINKDVINKETGKPNDGREFEPWIPIGRMRSENDYTSSCFSGAFDGAGHSISGIYINRTNPVENNFDGGVALFGTITNSPYIKNLYLKDSYIYSNYTRCAGIIATVASTTTRGNTDIEYCHNYANVSVTNQRSAGLVANIEKYACVTMKKCSNLGTISGTNVAGLVNYCNYGLSIYDCINYGTIIVDKYTGSLISLQVGGGILWGNKATIKNCINYGIICSNVGTGRNLGGIAFALHGGGIENCVNYGKIIDADNSSGAFVSLWYGGYIKNSFYLESSCPKAYGKKETRANLAYQSCSEEQMKSQKVLMELNANVPKDCSRWVTGVDGFPTLEWVDSSGILPYTPPVDVNTDGTVNSSDVVALYNIIGKGGGDAEQKLRADVNGDGTINSADVVTVYNYIVDGK